MLRTARPERVFALGLAGIALVTLWRVALLPFDRADLFTDDAQYWLWGQELAWGYYSKPPLIGWILRASTAIGGEGMFWIRLPLPLFHAVTAFLVALIGRRLFDARIGGIAGFALITLPGVAVASLLVSTDTPMVACFALAMLAQLHLAERRSVGWALVMGAAVGVGLLAKYAMVYFPLSAAIAALLLPRARIGWRDAGIAAVVALVLIAPNIWWNLTNGLTTLHHTADNADWQGGPTLVGLVKFLVGQFGLAGPVLFGGYLAGLPAARRGGAAGYLAAMSVPVFLLVSVQAVIAGANANWAAVSHLSAVILGVAVLQGRRRWLLASFAINLGLTVAIPVSTLYATSLPAGDGLLLSRYVGRADVSRKAAEIAKEQGLGVLVSGDRAELADFFYTLRDSGLALYAEPVKGFPPHHYAQKHPLPPGPGEVLFISHSAEGPACTSTDQPVEVARWQPAQGYSTKMFYAHRVARSCWFGPAGG